MSDQDKSIKFAAQVNTVKTLPDMGLRLVLDFSENDIMQAAMLMECKKMGVVLDIVATPKVVNINEPDTADGKKSRHGIKSLRGS